MKQRLWVVLSLLLVATMLLAACGGNGPTPTAAPPQPTGAEIATQALPATQVSHAAGRTRSTHIACPFNRRL